MMENLRCKCSLKKMKTAQLNLHFSRVNCCIVTSVHLFGLLLIHIWKEVVTACLLHIHEFVRDGWKCCQDFPNKEKEQTF